jgi:hypothetical protein
MKPFASQQYRKRTANGMSGDECCICGKETSGQNGAIHVPVDHACGEFVTEEQATERGEAISYFPVGPECAKKWSNEFKCHSVRFRRGKQGLIAYDEQTARR